MVNSINWLVLILVFDEYLFVDALGWNMEVVVIGDIDHNVRRRLNCLGLVHFQYYHICWAISICNVNP